jgi:peptide-methionine (S)-S-oxide reductase
MYKVAFPCTKISLSQKFITMPHNEIINTQDAIATFGAGCFWCVEAVFQDLEGVKKVVSGYEGGKIKNPTYKEICTGTTGHAEVIQVTYDPTIVDFNTLLEVFFTTHDPTTLNRQGNDKGTQYRSVIFYHTDEQKRLAEAGKIAAGHTGAWRDPIVTEISPSAIFYPAENYHQNFYNDNESYPYCQFVVAPKVAKFRKDFKEKLKKL